MSVREQLPDGSVILKGESCSFTYRRLSPGVLVVTVEGYDKGEHGMAPLDEMTNEVKRFGALRLFVDTQGATGVVTEVREAWTAWFQANQPNLKPVWIYVDSRFMEQAVSVAKFLSRTGDLMKITSDRAVFERELGRAQ